MSEGTEPWLGCRRGAFLVAKSFVSLDGTPPMVDQWQSTCCINDDGRGALSRVIRRTSHGLRGCSRGDVSIFSGVMIHRTTFDRTRGFNDVDLRASRKEGTVVPCLKAIRLIVASGIFSVSEGKSASNSYAKLRKSRNRLLGTRLR